MGIFSDDKSKKEPVQEVPKPIQNSNPYDTDMIQRWITRVVDVEQRVRSLELEAEDLRNKVLRKIQLKENKKRSPFG